MLDELGAGVSRNTNKQRCYLRSDSSVSVWACLPQNGSISKYNFSCYRRLKHYQKESHIVGKLRNTHRHTHIYSTAQGRWVFNFTKCTKTWTRTHTHRGSIQRYCFSLKQLDLVPDLKSCLLNTTEKGQECVIWRFCWKLSGKKNTS